MPVRIFILTAVFLSLSLFACAPAAFGQGKGLPCAGFFLGEGTLVVSDTAPGASGGVERGDVLEALDGAAVRDRDAALARIGAKSAGDTLQVTVRRGERSLALTVTVITLSAAGEAFFDDASRAFEGSRYTEALRGFERARDCYVADANFPGEALASVNIGCLYGLRGDMDKALAFYHKALALCRGEDRFSRALRAFAYANIARTAFLRSDLAAASDYWRKALEIYTSKDARDEAGEASAHAATADIQFMCGRYDEALENYRRALAIYTSPGVKDLRGEASMYNSLGALCLDRGELSEALSYHEKALAIAVGERSPLIEASTYESIACVRYMQGEYEKALEFLRKALAIYTDANIACRLGEASCYDKMGTVLSDQGRYGEVLEYRHKALAIHREMGYLIGESADYNNIGVVYFFQGDYGESLKYHGKARELNRKLGYTYGAALSESNFGELRYSMGDSREALAHFAEAVASFARMGCLPMVGRSLTIMGQVYLRESRFREAVEALERAREIFEKTGQKPALARSVALLGEAALREGRGQDALALLEKAGEINAQGGLRFTEAHIQCLAGEACLALRRYGEAADRGRSALDTAAKLHARDLEWRCLWLLAQAAEGQGDEEGAVGHLRGAVRVIEEMTGKLEARDVKKSFLKADDKMRVYEALIRLLMKRGMQGEAFEVLEKLRATLIEESVAGFRPRSGDPELEKRLEKLKQLTAAMEKAKQRVSGAASREEAESASRLLASSSKEFFALLNLLQQEHPEVYGKLVVNRWGLKELRDAVPSDGAVVEYCMLDDALYIYLMRDREFRTWVVPVKKAELDGLVDDFRSLIRRRAPLEAVAEELYGHLVKPIEDDVAGAKTLVIVPYGSLFNLPFHALVRRKEDGNPEYLARWKRICYLTCIPLLEKMKQARSAEPRRKALLAFGDPEENLPQAGEEVSELKTLYGEDATVFLHGDATKKRFLTMAGEYEMVHVAAHGRLSPSPLTSYLGFAPPFTGRLTLEEVASDIDLTLGCRLLTLSACSTAAQPGREGSAGSPGGDELQGRELMSMANILAEKDVHAVIATLWPVSDASTKELMGVFYRRLKSGDGDFLDALQHAQLSLMDGKAYRHPFYWAPFIFVGDWRR